MAKRVRVGDVANIGLPLDDPKTDFFTSTDADDNAPGNNAAQYRPQTYLLTEEQIGALSLKCAITGRKKNELIREILDEALGRYIEQYKSMK